MIGCDILYVLVVCFLADFFFEKFSLLSFDLRGQAEKEFKVEVEAIGRVRHKNLVRLLGYCAEGAHRYI